MGVLSWLYTNNAKKNMVVKIVHPGGHSELHDSPVLAANILKMNPRCCVTHPNVFHQPWAIVAPETTLMPGQKFYVVPKSTIRKLQRNAMKYHPSLLNNQKSQKTQVDKNEDGDEDDDDDGSSCCSFGENRTPSLSYACLKSSDEEGQNRNSSCFTCFLKGSSKNSTTSTGEDLNKETRKLSASEAKIDDKIGESPKRHGSLDYWEPNLESIIEELTTPSLQKERVNL